MKAELQEAQRVPRAEVRLRPDRRPRPAAPGTWSRARRSTNNILLGIQLFLGIVGALTLLIGGVGVANIMYAVVKERTREIGVKMALGAKRRWIIVPFVLEGLVYTLIGGALGITIATLLVARLSFVPIEDNKVLSFLGRPTLSPQIGVATSLSSASSACWPATSPRGAPRRSIPRRRCGTNEERP